MLTAKPLHDNVQWNILYQLPVHQKLLNIHVLISQSKTEYVTSSRYADMAPGRVQKFHIFYVNYPSICTCAISDCTLLIENFLLNVSTISW